MKDKLIRLSDVLDVVRKAYIWNDELSQMTLERDISKIPPGIDQATAGQWIPISSGHFPEQITPVNVTYINRNPASYYSDIKNTPFTGTALYCKDRWYWYSEVCEDLLKEYGYAYGQGIDKGIEVIAWQKLPEPYMQNGIVV